MFGPKHRAVDVAQFLAEGLRNGTITLDDNPKAAAVSYRCNSPAPDHLTHAIQFAETISVDISPAERERLAERIEAAVFESAEAHKAMQSRSAGNSAN
jgi:hypothetical protein